MLLIGKKDKKWEMVISKSAIVSVAVTTAMLSTGMDPLLAFLVGYFGITALYRIGLKKCYNIFNPMALGGTGAAGAVFYFTQSWIFALVLGLAISVAVGFLFPA